MDVKPRYKQTAVGIIPDDWEVILLASVAAYTNGKAHEKCISDLGKYIVVNSKFVSTNGEVIKYSDHPLSLASKGEILMVMSDVPNGRAIARCFLVDRDERYTVNQRICAIRPLHVDGKLLAYKLDRNPYYLAFDDGVKQTNLRKDDVLSCPLAFPPTKVEQEAIAGVLTDADALIESLEQLIAKKHHLKQGAMQELLIGKKRLPGFSGAWEVEALGEVASATKGTQLPRSETSDNDRFPHLNGGITPSGYAERANTPGGTIAISEGGNSCGYVQFMVGEYWCGGHCYSVVPRSIDNRFLYHALKTRQDSIMALRVGSGLPNVQKTALLAFKLSLPGNVLEQTAIAIILSDMDAEIATLEVKLAKIRRLKQGMMQELLTGRIRLL
jgi:type I restriction enzyme S subunit